MALNTNTEVQTISRVLDGASNLAAAATEAAQKVGNDLLRDIKDRLTVIRTSAENKSTLVTDTHVSSSTSPEALPTHSVPDGGTVVVTPLRGNSGPVYVGDDVNQPITLESPKDIFTAEVTDTAEIYVRTPTSGDGVGVTWSE